MLKHVVVNFIRGILSDFFKTSEGKSYRRNSLGKICQTKFVMTGVQYLSCKIILKM